MPIIGTSPTTGGSQLGLVLSNPNNGGVINSGLANLSIVDDGGSIAFSSVAYSVIERQSNAVLTLVRTGGSNGVVSVTYAYTGGTATPYVDFGNPTGTVSFASGETVKNLNLPVYDDGLIEGPQTANFTLGNPDGGALVGQPATTTLTVFDSNAGVIDTAGAAITYESIAPANGVIDPNETVTVQFALRNIGLVNTVNLVATLLNGNGVAVAATNAVQTYGAVQAGGSAVSKPFTFTCNATNGQTLTANLQLQDGATNLGVVSFSFAVGRVSQAYANNSQIIINDATDAGPSPSTPYPSTINVSGLGGVVTKVTASVSGLAHDFPQDIEMLLVGPQGSNGPCIMLMGYVGGGSSISSVNLTFDDASTNKLTSAKIVSGTYHPTNMTPAANIDLVPPAPQGTYTNVLAAFNGVNPNGPWSLYVEDADVGLSGFIASGWSLNITTVSSVVPTADLAVGVVAAPSPARVNNSFVYTLAVTNFGPSIATNVIVSSQFPPAPPSWRPRMASDRRP